MIKKNTLNEKPLIGFFNLFYNFGETCRSIRIAQRYIESGGKAIFFSHGGRYEHMAKDIGCEVIRVKPIYNDEIIELFWACSRAETFKKPFSKSFLNEHITEEIKAIKNSKIKMLVSTNNFPSSISARAAGVPLIAVTPQVKKYFTTYPEDAEFFFTRLIPNAIKLRFLNWYFPRSKTWVKPFIKVGKKYNVKSFKVGRDTMLGDYNFYVDCIEFFGIDKSSIPPNDYYVGHDFLDELYNLSLDKKRVLKEEKELENHIKRKGKSILLSLGSSGTKEIFIKILKALNKTDYNVIAVYTCVVDEKDLPKVNENILLKEFVPSMKKLNGMVDLAIIHGGKSTVYTAAYSGKPVIGFPMQFDHWIVLSV